MSAITQALTGSGFARSARNSLLETKIYVAVTHNQLGGVPACGGLTTHSAFHRSKKLNSVES